MGVSGGLSRWLLCLVVAHLLTACAEGQLAVHVAKSLIEGEEDSPPGTSPENVKIGRPYQVNGVWYYPTSQPGYDETGIASWYGKPFHGRATANGERFDMNDLTAAHKTLPLPSRVRVTNLENGRSLVLRVNDRGPFVNGRIIDVSRRGAQLLGFESKGTAPVRVTLLQDDDAGPGETRVAARGEMPALPQGDVVAETLPPPPGVKQTEPTRPNDAAVARVAKATPRPAGSTGEPDTVEPVVQIVPVKPTQIFVQAGAFLRYDNAMRLRAQLAGYGPARITTAMIDSQEFFRVRLGPLLDVASADRMLDKVISGGFKDAQIVVD